MVAVFARSNHPVGFGFGPGGSGAHGYSVIGVRCRNRRQLERVIEHVRNEGIDLPDRGRNIYPNGKPEKGYDRTVNHETVHHKNGIKDDNRIENLQLRVGAHGPGQRFRCARCGSQDLAPVAI